LASGALLPGGTLRVLNEQLDITERFGIPILLSGIYKRRELVDAKLCFEERR
jgi:hypothetical protein